MFWSHQTPCNPWMQNLEAKVKGKRGRGRPIIGGGGGGQGMKDWQKIEWCAIPRNDSRNNWLWSNSDKAYWFVRLLFRIASSFFKINLFSFVLLSAKIGVTLSKQNSSVFKTNEVTAFWWLFILLVINSTSKIVDKIIRKIMVLYYITSGLKAKQIIWGYIRK